MAERKSALTALEVLKHRLEVQRSEFQNATDVNGVLDVVTGMASRYLWPNYQHYTTLSRLQAKLEGQWFLSRGDSTRLNDAQECRKFGSPDVLSHTWESCFSAATAESAAMWAMYCKKSPFAVRITIPNAVMQSWMTSLERGKCCRVYVQGKRKEKNRYLKRAIGVQLFGLFDLVYAATDFVQNKQDKLDRDRRNALMWNQVFANVEDVRKLIADERMTGLLKDYEWRQELESRLIVRTEKVERADARVYVSVPKSVRESMRYTLSPWLDKEHEQEVVDLISGMLTRHGLSTADKIYRSVLSGALNF